jgi:hypothetical protein
MPRQLIYTRHGHLSSHSAECRRIADITKNQSVEGVYPAIHYQRLMLPPFRMSRGGNKKSSLVRFLVCVAFAPPIGAQQGEWSVRWHKQTPNALLFICPQRLNSSFSRALLIQSKPATQQAIQSFELSGMVDSSG